MSNKIKSKTKVNCVFGLMIAAAAAILLIGGGVFQEQGKVSVYKGAKCEETQVDFYEHSEYSEEVRQICRNEAYNLGQIEMRNAYYYDVALLSTAIILVVCAFAYRTRMIILLEQGK